MRYKISNQYDKYSFIFIQLTHSQNNFQNEIFKFHDLLELR